MENPFELFLLHRCLSSMLPVNNEGQMLQERYIYPETNYESPKQ